MNIYQENGCADRKEYLETLAEEMEVPLHIVLEMADLYGPNEDFDGLVTFCEDYEDYEDYEE